jgi:anti-sigma regulatory factor (Ser/Thr protein kinase)
MASTPAPPDRATTTTADRSGAPGLPSAPGVVVHATLTVPGRPEHVATTRRFVTAVLGEDHPETETAILLTSELVTNSLRHSASGCDGAYVSVAASRTPCWLRVEVTDDGAPTAPRLRPGRQRRRAGTRAPSR